MKTFQIITFLSILTLAFGFSQSQTKEDQLVAIANEYKAYSKSIESKIEVTDSAKYKWTIALCVKYDEEVMGYYHDTNSLFFSNISQDKSPHGDQLYTLYVKNLKSYQNIESGQPIGQTLVKETWNVKEVPKDSINEYNFVRQSKKDSNWYRPISVSELFIMYKEKPGKNNDNGWVYGIVDLKNQNSPKVLSKGNISSCISCHKNTKYDRMFGR